MTNTDSTTFTGRSEPVGVSDGRVTVAFQVADGTWSFHGFRYPTLTAAREAARKAGY